MKSPCNKAVNLCFHGFCCLPSDSPLVSIPLLNQRARSITLGPSVTTGRSANGTQGIIWAKIAMFTLNTCRNKQVNKLQPHNKRLTHKEKQWNKFLLNASTRGAFMCGLNPHTVPMECQTVCPCYLVCSFMFVCWTGSFLLLTLGWRHQHQNNLLCHFNAL